MKTVILKSKDKEVQIEVQSKRTALKEAREYVRENLNRVNQWLAYYEGYDLLGNASRNILYTATGLDGVHSFESGIEADGETTFYTREEAINKRRTYKTEAKKLLDESEKRLRGADVELTIIQDEDSWNSDPKIALVVEVEDYEFFRYIDGYKI